MRRWQVVRRKYAGCVQMWMNPGEGESEHDECFRIWVGITGECHYKKHAMGDGLASDIPTLAALRETMAKHCKPRLLGDGEWTPEEVRKALDFGVRGYDDGRVQIYTHATGIGEHGWSHILTPDRKTLYALAQTLPAEAATALRRALGETDNAK